MPIFTTLGAACAKAWGFTSGLITDQYFNLVSLLLPGNGTNGAQNNTFLDSSSNTFTITRNGNTTQGTFSPFSQTGWGNYFIASSGLRIAHTTDFDFSTGNFTVESFIYPVSANANNNIIVVGALGSGFAALILKINASNQVQLLMSTAGSAWDVNQTSTSTVSLNTWSHIAVVRNGSGSNNLQVYVNGTSYISTTYTSSPVTTGSYEYVGTNGTDAFLGYMSNARIVKGQALSTGAFTPPTAPISSSIVGWTGVNAASSITGTVPLVTCQSNRFVDTSSSPKTITVLGSPSVTPFSPFAPTQSYSAAAVGGSGYFDGNGDQLNGGNISACAFGTDPYTVELWVYLTAPVSSTHAPQFINNDASGGFLFINDITASGGLQIARRLVGSVLSANTSLISGQWNHVVAVRSGTGANQTSIFVNGSRVANGQDSTNWTVNGPLKIGGFDTVNFYLTGNMSGLRVVKGSAVYDPTQTTLTVPTSPPTAITNTSLLLNFTNAGVVDATAKNVLETVGNAQISTTQSKWGGGSMYFDGTGDYLVAPNSPLLDQIGDFTHEMWYYRSGNGAAGQFDVCFYKDITNYLYMSVDRNNSYKACIVKHNIGFIVTGTTALASATWYHLAFSRSGSTVRLFVNGVLDGSATESTNTSGSAVSYFGGSANHTFNGYLDDIRITRGLARYTANFTPPTAPFPVQ